jgi:hypothetical protein
MFGTDLGKPTDRTSVTRRFLRVEPPLLSGFDDLTRMTVTELSTTMTKAFRYIYSLPEDPRPCRPGAGMIRG